MKRLLVLKMLLLMLLLFAALPLLAQGTQDDTVWTHDFNTPEEVNCVKFSPNGNYIAACIYSTIYLLDTETGKVIKEFIGHEKTIYSLSFSITGNTLFSAGGDKNVILWNTTTGEQITSFQHFDAIGDIDISPNGKLLLSGTYNADSNNIELWDIETGERLKVLTDGRRCPKIQFLPSGEYFATGSTIRKSPDGWGSAINLWSTNTWEKITSLGAHDDICNDLAFSPDGTMLATASMDGTAKIWSIEERKLLMVIVDQGNMPVYSVAFSPDSRYIITASSSNNNVSIWDIKTKKEIYTYSIKCNIVLDVSRDGKYIAVGRYHYIMILNAKWSGSYIEQENKKEEIIYPNPSDNTFNIEFSINKPSNTSIKIFDTQGILIENILNEYLDIGLHSITWNPNLVSSGTYFCKIQSGSYSKTFKLIVNK